MKNILVLAVLAGALAACNQGGGADMDMEASGGSAGAMGPGFCDSPPSDAEDMSQWEELCAPDGGR